MGALAKRALDLALGGPVFLVCLPVIGVAALLIYVETGRPIFFRQERVGYTGNLITILKLRTMYRDIPSPEAIGQVDVAHALVTPVGRWLRRFKVDELSQLTSVLVGSMSLVGPRPTLPSQVVGYTSAERERLAVPPGLTGWAQVNGNTKLSWPDRIALDRWYVRHRSFWLDIWILGLTLAVVVRGERANRGSLERARAEGL